MTGAFTHRIATLDDLAALHSVMERSIGHNQSAFLDPAQVTASHKVMGLDSQLVRDGTYFIVECGGRIAGCGGWSFRSTLYGGDDSVVAREPELLDPTTDAAKVRAMYTDPDFTRRGIGRLILALCEAAARDAGFTAVELMATAAGVPLYRASGYEPADTLHHAHVDGVDIPLLRMRKALA